MAITQIIILHFSHPDMADNTGSICMQTEDQEIPHTRQTGTKVISRYLYAIIFYSFYIIH